MRGSKVLLDEGDNDEDDNKEDGSEFSDENLPQVVAMCVVSSFIENKLHPDEQALVPTILIDFEQFRLCLHV